MPTIHLVVVLLFVIVFFVDPEPDIKPKRREIVKLTIYSVYELILGTRQLDA